MKHNTFLYVFIILITFLFIGGCNKYSPEQSITINPVNDKYIDNNQVSLPTGYTLSVLARWHLCHIVGIYSCPVHLCNHVYIYKNGNYITDGYTSLVEDYPGWVSFDLEQELEDGTYVVLINDGMVYANNTFVYSNDETEHYAIAYCDPYDDKK